MEAQPSTGQITDAPIVPTHNDCETHDYIEQTSLECDTGQVSVRKIPASGPSYRPTGSPSYLRWFPMYCQVLVAADRQVYSH